MNSPMEWYLTYNGTAAISSDDPFDDLTAKCWGCQPAQYIRQRGRHDTAKEGGATKHVFERLALALALAMATATAMANGRVPSSISRKPCAETAPHVLRRKRVVHKAHQNMLAGGSRVHKPASKHQGRDRNRAQSN